MAMISDDDKQFDQSKPASEPKTILPDALHANFGLRASEAREIRWTKRWCAVQLGARKWPDQSQILS